MKKKLYGLIVFILMSTLVLVFINITKIFEFITINTNGAVGSLACTLITAIISSLVSLVIILMTNAN